MDAIVRSAHPSAQARPRDGQRSGLAAHHRPAHVLIALVVLVRPGGAAAVALVPGNRHQRGTALFLVVLALQQFSVAGRTTPVALDAGAGVAQVHFLKFALAVQVFGHGLAGRFKRAGECAIVRLAQAARGARSGLSPWTATACGLADTEDLSLPQGRSLFSRLCFTLG